MLQRLKFTIKKLINRDFYVDVNTLEYTLILKKDLREGKLFCDEGICDSMERLFYGKKSYNLNKHFKSWNKFSGCILFPVPPPPDYQGVSRYQKPSQECFYDTMDNCSMWEGEYGKLRIELLNHIISNLEKDLKEYLPLISEVYR